MYARFKQDIKDNDGKITFKANPRKYTKKTRYAIMDEDAEGNLYISLIPNEIDNNTVARFSSDCIGEIFDLVED